MEAMMETVNRPTETFVRPAINIPSQEDIALRLREYWDGIRKYTLCTYLNDDGDKCLVGSFLREEDLLNLRNSGEPLNACQAISYVYSHPEVGRTYMVYCQRAHDFMAAGYMDSAVGYINKVIELSNEPAASILRKLSSDIRSRNN
jgi:hypothetical protein